MANRIQVLPGTLGRIASAVCKSPEYFYLKEAEAVVTDGQLYPSLEGRFEITQPGHYHPVPGLTHAPDSIAAAGQAAYTLFAQASLSGLLTDFIPQMELEAIAEIFRSGNGKWAYLKRIEETDFKHLPTSFVGVAKVTKISPAPEGYIFDLQTKFMPGSYPEGLSGLSSHRHSFRFSAKF